jgi:hypothetical protein
MTGNVQRLTSDEADGRAGSERLVERSKSYWRERLVALKQLLEG